MARSTSILWEKGGECGPFYFRPLEECEECGPFYLRPLGDLGRNVARSTSVLWEI